MMPARVRGLSGWIAAFAAFAFLASAGWRLSSRTPDELFSHWRAYDDLALGLGFAARGEFPVSPYRVRDFVRRDRDAQFNAFRERLLVSIARASIRPHEPWRVVPIGDLAEGGRWRLGRRLDDVGRALLLGGAFAALGGASPFLVFWLGVLASAAAVGWAAFEASRAGFRVTAAVLGLGAACSAFLLDLSITGYSAAAFHIVGLWTVVALSLHALSPDATTRGLVVRSAIGGLAFGVCALCRGTVLTFAPVLIAALGLTALRLARGRSRSFRLVLGVTLLTLFGLPYVALSESARRLTAATSGAYGRDEVPRYHDPSLLVWKGLGDFDRTKGYQFWDMAGQAAVRKHSPTGAFDQEGEIRLRQTIIADILSDPGWYAAILARRVVETVAMPKLWRYGPRDGASFEPSRTVNEGVIDNYYGLSRQADWLAVGPYERELPALVLLLPWILLSGTVGLGRRWPRLGAAGRRASAGLVPMALTALAVLPVPVLITTATAFDPQAFVLVHLLCAAFLAEGLWHAWREPRAV